MISRCQGDDTFNQWLPFNHSLCSKDVYSPSIYLDPHPHTQPSLPFALASSSLVILSTGSTIEKIRENGGL